MNNGLEYAPKLYIESDYYFIVRSRTDCNEQVYAPRGYTYTSAGVVKMPGKVVGCVEWGRGRLSAYRFTTHRRAQRCATGCDGIVLTMDK